MYSKYLIATILNLFLSATLVLVALYLNTNTINKNTPNSLQAQYDSKMHELNTYANKETIKSIDLLQNIKDVKRYISAFTTNIKVKFVEKNTRGAEYLLEGQSMHLLFLLQKIFLLKIDVKKIEFKGSNAAASIDILGKEQ